MNRWRAIFLAIVVMANFIVMTVLDGSCSRGLCDAGLFSGYMLLTFWLPFATAAALAFLWLWRSGGRA
jgi:hypothetical protein